MLPTLMTDDRFSEEPTDEQLATITALRAQQMQLKEMREFYLRLLDSLDNDFNFAHEEDRFRGKRSGCQHVGCMDASATCSRLQQQVLDTVKTHVLVSSVHQDQKTALLGIPYRIFNL